MIKKIALAILVIASISFPNILINSVFGPRVETKDFSSGVYFSKEFMYMPSKRGLEYILEGSFLDRKVSLPNADCQVAEYALLRSQIFFKALFAESKKRRHRILAGIYLGGFVYFTNYKKELESEGLIAHDPSKKEYKLVGEMDLFHFINAFIQNVDSNEQTQDKTDLSATMSKADIHYELLRIKNSVDTLIGGLNDK